MLVYDKWLTFLAYVFDAIFLVKFFKAQSFQNAIPWGLAFIFMTASLAVGIIIYLDEERLHRLDDAPWEKLSDSTSGYGGRKEWSSVIEGAAGRDEEFMERIARRALDEKISDLVVKKRLLRVDAKESERRPFLVMSSRRIKGCRMLVGAADFGNHLDVLLRVETDTAELELIRRAQERVKKFGRDKSGILEGKSETGDSRDGWITPEQMSPLDTREWSNCVGAVRGIVEDEAKIMADEMRGDHEKADAGAKGFIDIA